MKKLYLLFPILLPSFFNSCQDEPIEKADPSKVIAVDSELYNLIEKAAGNDFENDVRLFIEWTVGKLNYSVSTHRQMVSGLKHFAYFYPACAINVDKIYMPKKDRKLPVVLNIEEVLRLIQTTKNLKHRVVIAMLYGSGLRIGELLNLELSDFDFPRKQLHIRNGKGKKEDNPL